MKLIKLITLLVIVISSYNCIAQKKKEYTKLTIIVKDENNNPITGATILFDNEKYPRKTNRKGVFKIKLKKTPKEITVFSALYGIKKIKYLGQKNILITIVSDTKEFDIIAGNPKQTSVGAIQYLNIYDYLRGKVAGLRIRSDNVISIRGDNNREPLFILNGSQVAKSTFGDIVPSTIRTVNVLKGPETSIYCVRGMNGVIVVKTSL